MTDSGSFYDYYSRELTYLRQQGKLFAQKYPKVAQRLDFTAQESSDPHVERLLESFAYLTARLQKDIDDQFPRLTNGLLELLYPQFSHPLPSLSVAEFQVSPHKGKISEFHVIPRGTPLFIQTHEGTPCRFQTCYDVYLGPCHLVSAEILRASSDFPAASFFRSSRVLKLHLRSFAGGFKRLNLGSLRFFLEGSRLLKNSLCEGLFAQDATLAVTLGDPNHPEAVYELPARTLVHTGFKENEAVIPYPGHGHPGYRLMFEYFHFLEKFYFFTLENIFLPHDTQDITFYISLSERFSLKETEVSASNFKLHCTPIVNIFSKTSEPLRLDYRTHEYRLIPDVKEEKSLEIHSVAEVKAVREGSSQVETFYPYFSYGVHGNEKGKSFWISRRIPSTTPELGGTDVFLSFVDAHLDPSIPSERTVYATLLCTNRSLAHEIPVGAFLQPEKENPAAQIVCLQKPTLQYYPSTEGTSQWRLISHLNLNHLALSQGQESLEALREIIKLYGDLYTLGSFSELEALLDLKTSSVMRRFGKDAWRGFVSGTRIELTVDAEKDVQRNLFVFSSVLNHFFGLFASINSFTELTLYHSPTHEVWKTWQPLTGSKPLL